MLALPGGIFSLFHNFVLCHPYKVGHWKSYFFSISSHKINTFKVLPPYEDEIWTILAWKVPVWWGKVTCESWLKGISLFSVCCFATNWKMSNPNSSSDKDEQISGLFIIYTISIDFTQTLKLSGYKIEIRKFVTCSTNTTLHCHKVNLAVLVNQQKNIFQGFVQQVIALQKLVWVMFALMTKMGQNMIIPYFHSKSHLNQLVKSTFQKQNQKPGRDFWSFIKLQNPHMGN